MFALSGSNKQVEYVKGIAKKDQKYFVGGTTTCTLYNYPNTVILQYFTGVNKRNKFVFNPLICLNNADNLASKASKINRFIYYMAHKNILIWLETYGCWYLLFIFKYTIYSKQNVT